MKRDSQLTLIGESYFKKMALRSALFALIRNALFAAFFIWSFSIWIYSDSNGRTNTLIIESILIAFFVWRSVLAVSRLLDFKRHPFFKRLALFGEPLAVAREIEEYVATGKAHRSEDCIITDKYLVTTSMFATVLTFDDIAWLYPKSSSFSFNFIPLGTSQTIELYTHSKKFRLAPLSMTQSPEAYAELVKRATRARVGFSAENQAWWDRTSKESPKA